MSKSFKLLHLSSSWQTWRQNWNKLLKEFATARYTKCKLRLDYLSFYLKSQLARKKIAFQATFLMQLKVLYATTCNKKSSCIPQFYLHLRQVKKRQFFFWQKEFQILKVPAICTSKLYLELPLTLFSVGPCRIMSQMLMIKLPVPYKDRCLDVPVLPCSVCSLTMNHLLLMYFHNNFSVDQSLEGHCQVSSKFYPSVSESTLWSPKNVITNTVLQHLILLSVARHNPDSLLTEDHQLESCKMTSC